MDGILSLISCTIICYTNFTVSFFHSVFFSYARSCHFSPNLKKKYQPTFHISFHRICTVCLCVVSDAAGDLAVEDVPQLVLLTFDDSVNDLNKQLYNDLFNKGRVNPNGCPISATFYVSHEWTDYSQVQNLYAEGHEMASHTVS